MDVHVRALAFCFADQTLCICDGEQCDCASYSSTVLHQAYQLRAETSCRPLACDAALTNSWSPFWIRRFRLEGPEPCPSRSRRSPMDCACTSINGKMAADPLKMHSRLWFHARSNARIFTFISKNMSCPNRQDGLLCVHVDLKKQTYLCAIYVHLLAVSSIRSPRLPSVVFLSL